MEDLCVSVIGICCGCRPGLNVFCPVLQSFVLYLLNFFIIFKLIFINIKVYIAEKETK